MTTLNTIVEKAEEMDLISKEEAMAARKELKKVVITNVANTSYDPDRIEALAVHLGQNESLYLDSVGAGKMTPPRAGEDAMTHRMRADAHFRVQRALFLAEAIDTMFRK